MCRFTFLSETIFRRIEHFARSKLIQTNLTEPNVQLFMNVFFLALVAGITGRPYWPSFLNAGFILLASKWYLRLKMLLN